MKIKQSHISISLLILILSLTLINVNYPNDHLNNSNDINEDNENVKFSLISGKIHIDNMYGLSWADAKIAGICTGFGTYSEPYIIEDLVIDGEGSGGCIIIENSNVFFKIENCTVYNSARGIQLLHASNSQLLTNDASNISEIAIDLHNYINSTISGNIVNNNGGSGMDLTRCTNNTISGNTINSNAVGIRLFSSDNNTITRNNVNNNNLTGILCFNSTNNIFSENAINYNEDGIWLYNCNNNTLLGNTANYNTNDGIILASDIFGITSNNTVSSNNLDNNDNKGIYLLNCTNNTISGNNANSNINTGIHLEYCDTNIISDNTANNHNLHGIHLYSSNNNTVSENTANNNGDDFFYAAGIRLQYSDNNIVFGNILRGNTQCILEQVCDGNVIENNTCGDIGSSRQISGYNLITLLGVGCIITIIIIKKKKQN